MTRVKRYGRELVVDDALVTEYLNQGYSVIDDRGNEIAPGKAMDYETAMNHLAKITAHDKALAVSLEEANATIKKLQSEVKKLKKAAKEAADTSAE